MDILAVALLGFFALGYFVLAGADIGVGMMLPFLGRDPGQRRIVIAVIAPFFLANEVWLVATAGVLIGAFPVLEGKLFSGLFPAVTALLLGWIVRDLGLWLRGRANARVWWWMCDAAITVGSWGVALSWGWITASVLAGTGALGVATGPGAVLAALAIAGLFALHGLAFAGLRLTGDLRHRAQLLPAGKSGRRTEIQTYLCTVLGMLAVGLALGLRLPLLDSSADPETLALLVPAILLMLPFLVGSQVIVWRLFRHRVTGPSYL